MHCPPAIELNSSATTRADSAAVRFHGLRAALASVALLVACVGDPPPHEAALHDGQAELAMGNAGLALAQFELAHQIGPAVPEVLAGLAVANLELDQPATALEWFDRLEEVAPHALDTELTGKRCDALERALEEQIRAFEWASAVELAEQTPAAAVCKSESLSERSIRAHLGAAGQAREGGDHDEAVHHLEWVLAERPGHPDATLASLGWLLQDGQRKAALRLLSEALAQHPKDDRLIEAMVELLESR